MKIIFKKLNSDVITPKKGTKYSAGFDICAYLSEGEVNIEPGCTKLIPTGIAMAVSEGYFGGLYARSGLASKRGLRPANCVGVLDSDYRGELMVPLHNDSSSEQIIKNGDRIAQLIIMAAPMVELEEGCLDDTERGTGGFGSTGTK